MATTRLLDRIAHRHGLPLITTPVGFKFLADLFLQDRIMFGGEESASIAVRDHLPEKDGILAGVLLAEMLAVAGKKLAELVEDLFRNYGERFDVQKTIPLTPERARRLKSLAAAPPAKLAGRPVRECVTIDGVRFDFDEDDWLLLRHSGNGAHHPLLCRIRLPDRAPRPGPGGPGGPGMTERPFSSLGKKIGLLGLGFVLFVLLIAAVFGRRDSSRSPGSGASMPPSSRKSSG